LDKIIKITVATYDVNPNKVNLMGYSAGGDGLYRLAGRMADRWAAACAFAGHPGDGNMENLKNVNFILAAGG
jgi:poly(3-hydroxybutyrate) depolymerase